MHVYHNSKMMQAVNLRFLGALLLCSRPRTVTDVSHQEEVVATLQKALESANVSVGLLSCNQQRKSPD